MGLPPPATRKARDLADGQPWLARSGSPSSNPVPWPPRTDQITDPSVKQNTEQFYAQLAITPRTSPTSSRSPSPGATDDAERDPAPAHREARLNPTFARTPGVFTKHPPTRLHRFSSPPHTQRSST